MFLVSGTVLLFNFFVESFECLYRMVFDYLMNIQHPGVPSTPSLNATVAEKVGFHTKVIGRSV